MTERLPGMPDQHPEDHEVRDHQGRHDEGGDVVGGAELDVVREPLVERVDRIEAPDHVEEPAEGDGDATHDVLLLGPICHPPRRIAASLIMPKITRATAIAANS